MVPAVTSPKDFEAVGDTQLTTRGRLHHAGPWICFVATLLACLFHNVVAYDTRANLFWDAAHYIDSSRDLAACASHWLAGDGPGAHDLLFRAGQKVLLDGPVLPFLGAAVFLVLGKAPAYDNLVVFVVIQSLLQAAGAVLSCLLVGRLTGSSRWGLSGGLAWGLYPSAVIAAGVYMSETVTTVLLLTLTWVASGLVVSEEPPNCQGPPQGNMSSTGDQFPTAGACNAPLPRTRQQPLQLLGRNALWSRKLHHSRVSYLARSICLGALAGLLLVTKPALIFAAAWVGLIALALLRTNGRRLHLVLAGLLGCCIVAAMWAAFTKWSTNQVYLTPQRVPTHNMVMGFDIETDGFGTGPGSALDELYREHDGPLPVAAALSKAHPAEVANLLLRKPERMWALPWNDLRRTFMGVPAAYLAWWHQLIVLAGILGAVAVLSKPAAGTSDGDSHTAVSRSADLIAWSAVGIVLCHLIYVVFEAIPRYGFTSMPFIVLLATFLLFEAIRHRTGSWWLLWMIVPVGCWFLMGLDLIPYLVPISGSVAGAVWLESGIKMAMILVAAAVVGTVLGFPGEIKVVRVACVVSIALFGSATVAAHAFNTNAVREWRCKLKDGQSASRQVFLPPPSAARSSLLDASGARRYERPDWAAILLDTDRNGASARVAINARALEGSPRSVYWYDVNVYRTLTDIEQKAHLFRKPLESVRQWRVVHVPPAWLNLNGPNQISVEPPPGGRATVFGDYPPVVGEKRLLSFAFAAGKIWSSVSSLEARVLSPIPAAPVAASSWMSSAGAKVLSDLSPSPGVQSGDYRIHLLLGHRRAADKGEATSSTVDDGPASTGVIEIGKTLKTDLPEASFQPPLGGRQGAIPRAGPTANIRLWHRRAVPVSTKGTGKSHLLIRLKGSVISSGSSKSASLALILKGADQAKPLILPGALHSLTAEAQAHSFEITEEVPPWLPEHGLAAVQIEIHSAPDVLFRDLKLEIEPVRRPDFSRDRVSIL